MVDTHCHLVDPQFVNDLGDVLRRAQGVGITRIVNVGYDVETSRKAMTMSDEHPWLLPAIGIHPNEAADESIKEMDKIEVLLSDGKVVAIGETGLDYYRDFSPRKAQQELFRMHIALASKGCLPLLIHTRNSAEDAIQILKEEDYHLGVFHCYSGSYEQAKIIMDMGFYISFAGVLTYSRRAREISQNLPHDRILLETDAPFLAPIGHQGRRNEPAFITETLNFAANTLDIIPEKLEAILDANARELFSLQ
jgi:TatD DNase family protein